jgi:hypothetical protein
MLRFDVSCADCKLGQPPALDNYMLTFGSTGDGMVPVSCQEQAVSVALCIGLWSHAKKHHAED